VEEKGDSRRVGWRFLVYLVMRVEVILHPAEFRDFAACAHPGTVCVVFDVLRATSSMVTALANGVSALLPVASVEEAFLLKNRTPGALLGGERHGDRVQGFDLGNSPAEYCQQQGATIVMTTTNGTGAVQACKGAECVLIGALLNLDAVARVVARAGAQRLVAVCAGTGPALALEDVWAAGALLNHFLDPARFEWGDSARCAHALYSQWPNASAALRASSNGRALLAKGRAVDVDWCACLNRFDVVGELRDGAVQARVTSEGGGA
jgi:2-phosphosulfolactate phosphatase